MKKRISLKWFGGGWKTARIARRQRHKQAKAKFFAKKRNGGFPF